MRMGLLMFSDLAHSVAGEEMWLHSLNPTQLSNMITSAQLPEKGILPMGLHGAPWLEHS